MSNISLQISILHTISCRSSKYQLSSLFKWSCLPNLFPSFRHLVAAFITLTNWIILWSYISPFGFWIQTQIHLLSYFSYVSNWSPVVKWQMLHLTLPQAMWLLELDRWWWTKDLSRWKEGSHFRQECICDSKKYHISFSFLRHHTCVCLKWEVSESQRKYMKPSSKYESKLKSIEGFSWH